MTVFFESQENKDAAQRIVDGVSLALIGAADIWEPVGKWMVFALRDGRSPDGHMLYDSKDDAVRTMKGHSKDFCYLKVTPDGIRVQDAWRFLRINRMPMIDSTAPEHIINPILMPHMSNLTRRQRSAIAQQSERYRNVRSN